MAKKMAQVEPTKDLTDKIKGQGKDKYAAAVKTYKDYKLSGGKGGKK